MKIGLRGFTFVEVLVVVVAMSLLFGAGYASYRSFAKRQALEAAARNLIGDLRFAQQLASAGSNKPPGCDILDGYQFEIIEVPPKMGYQISPVCEGSEETEIKKVILDEDIYIEEPSIHPILFKVLEQGTNIPQGISTKITLAQVGHLMPSRRDDWAMYGADNLSVSITSGGEIFIGPEPAFNLCTSSSTNNCNAVCSSLGKTCAENSCSIGSCLNQTRYFTYKSTGVNYCWTGLCASPWVAGNCTFGLWDFYCCCK